MGKRSLKASPQGQIIAREAFEKKRLTQEQLAEAVGLSSRQSVWKFFTGRPIERYLFQEICFQLDLELEEIADLPKTESSKSLEPTAIKNLGVQGQVEMMRAQLKEQIETQCNTLESPLALTQPLLEQIYVLTRLLPQPSNQRWLEVADFQDTISSLERPSLTQLHQEPVSGMELISQHQKLMILGKPGAGKTTFMRYIALQCIQGNYRPDLVPILIQLRTEFTGTSEDEQFSLLKNIISVGESCYLSEDDTINLLEQGRFVLLLDGFDEVSEDDTELIFQEVSQWVKTYYQNPIIITSRSGFQKYYFAGFSYVELADFDWDQIEKFVHKWFLATTVNQDDARGKAAKFLQQLEQPNNQPIRELAVSPILLNLLCSVFKEREKFPTKRARLYQSGLDILLQRWDRARGIHRDQIYRELSLQDKMRLLSQIAAQTFSQGKYFFESSDILPIIEDYLKTLPNASPDLETLWLNSEAVLKAIEFQHGILVERAKDVYSFSHLTFQEYLFAKSIVSCEDTNRLQEQLETLASHTTDYRWREVILLTASMVPRVDFLVQSMSQSVRKIVLENQDLQSFLNLLKTKVESAQLSYRPCAVRAFYFGLLQNRDFNLAIALDENFASLENLVEPLSLDYALARALSDTMNLVANPDIKRFLGLCFCLDLEGKFSLEPQFKKALNQLKGELPAPEEDKETIYTWWQTQGKIWAEKFRRLLIDYRHLGYEGQLNQKQQEVWQQYYRGNEFLIECLNSDCQVSPAIKEEIEDNLLLTSL